jgi:hypothetical protein
MQNVNDKDTQSVNPADRCAPADFCDRSERYNMNSIKDYINSIYSLYENGTSHGYIYRDLILEVHEAYHGSNIWRNVVKAVKKRDKELCKKCGLAPAIGITHHTSYENWGKGDAHEISDCIYLCQSCHNTEHYNKDQVDVPFWARRRTREIRSEIIKKMFMNEI